MWLLWKSPILYSRYLHVPLAERKAYIFRISFKPQRTATRYTCRSAFNVGRFLCCCVMLGSMCLWFFFPSVYDEDSFYCGLPISCANGARACVHLFTFLHCVALVGCLVVSVCLVSPSHQHDKHKHTTRSSIRYGKRKRNGTHKRERRKCVCCTAPVKWEEW